MHRDDGVGLAAPQVGVNVRLMIFNPYGRERPGHERILANPELVSSSKLKATDDEGCLSFPGILGEIEVRVRLRNGGCVWGGTAWRARHPFL